MRGNALQCHSLNFSPTSLSPGGWGGTGSRSSVGGSREGRRAGRGCTIVPALCPQGSWPCRCRVPSELSRLLGAEGWDGPLSSVLGWAPGDPPNTPELHRQVTEEDSERRSALDVGPAGYPQVPQLPRRG